VEAALLKMTMPKGWTPEKIRKDARNYSLAAEARKLVEQQAAAKAKEEERRREAGDSDNRNTTMPNSYGYYCLCGHTQTEHNREFKINRGTMPKGMNTVESKTDFSHNACNVCECTNYIEREIAKRMGESWENFVKPQPQQRPPQQQKIRRSYGSWFYYSSSTYVMPVEDTGSSDDTSNNSNDTTTEVDTVDGDYEF
jgi:hypothetical protein